MGEVQYESLESQWGKVRRGPTKQIANLYLLTRAQHSTYFI